MVSTRIVINAVPKCCRIRRVGGLEKDAAYNRVRITSRRRLRKLRESSTTGVRSPAPQLHTEPLKSMPRSPSALTDSFGFCGSLAQGPHSQIGRGTGASAFRCQLEQAAK